MPDVQALEGLEVFGGLGPDELEKVAELMSEVSVGAGEWIFLEGDAGDTLYIIQEGSVDITQRITDELERTLVTLPAGAVFGEMVLVDPGVRSAGARAAEDCRMLALVRRDFFELAANDPDLGIKVFLNLAILLTGRLRRTNIAMRQAGQRKNLVENPVDVGLEGLQEGRYDVEIELLTGTVFQGAIVKISEEHGHPQLTVVDQRGIVHLVPHRAIAAVRAQVIGEEG
jgi:CRP-like cAMP-binding protein